MKIAIIMLISVLVLYLIFQAFYTARFFKKSEELIAKPVLREKIIGDTKNPEFKLLVDGDSVGAGVGSSSFETSVAGRVAEFYAGDYHVNFINNSVSGSRMATLVDRDLPKDKQDLILLIVSSNDLFHFSNLKEFKDATEKVLDKYSSNSAKLIIIGPGRVFDTGALPFFIKPVFRAKAPKYASIIAEIAKKHPNVVYVNPLNTKISRAEYGPSDASDRFHPNDEGHRFWFDLIKPHL